MSATKLLEGFLQDLEDSWGYTQEELSDIRDKVLVFANTISSDESMRKEVAEIAKDL